MRNPSHITFAALRTLLDELGFTERKGNGSCLIFEHEPSETVLYFRTYQPREKVDQTDLVVVRKFLNEKGVLARDDFERWTWQHPVS
jgi:hypothetical protein